MPQAIINLMQFCIQEIFLPPTSRWYLKFCQKILRFDSRSVSIDLNLTHLQTATVAGKANVKGLTATYTDGSTCILWECSRCDGYIFSDCCLQFVSSWLRRFCKF
jgi:hypothetical protein